MQQATLVFLFRDNEILLAMKKRGFGQGRWNGSGGKMKEGENIEETAKREAFEEIGVKISKMTEVGKLNFSFSKKPEWNQVVTVFKTNKWEGIESESEEMAPKWFKFDEIPYDSMWPDDKYWVPLMLKNKKIKASFVFGDGDVIEKMEVKEIEVK